MTSLFMTVQGTCASIYTAYPLEKWWCEPLVTAIGEAEAGGSHELF